MNLQKMILGIESPLGRQLTSYEVALVESLGITVDEKLYQHGLLFQPSNYSLKRLVTETLDNIETVDVTIDQHSTDKMTLTRLACAVLPNQYLYTLPNPIEFLNKTAPIIGEVVFDYKIGQPICSVSLV